MANLLLQNIFLKDHEYRVNVSSYRRKDVNDFSPRASTPGGSIYSDLNLYQQVSQTDWRHGFGFIQHSDASGYLRTEGLIDTRHEGIAMLFTNPRTPTDAGLPSFSEIRGFTRYTHWISASSYTHYWLAWGVGGMWKSSISNGSVWTWIDIFGASASYDVDCVFVNGKNVFVFADGKRPQYSTADLTSWTQTGTNANSIDYAWVVAHDGFVYAGKKQTATKTKGNEVYYASKPDLSDLHGDPTDDPNCIFIGDDTGQTVGAVSYINQLLVFRTDSLYTVNLGRDGAKRTLDFSDLIDPVNFSGHAIHNGSLIFPVLDRMYQWNGTRLSDITPKRLTDTYPYVSYGKFDNLIAIGNYLWCTARTNETNYTESILVFDGVSWHRMVDVFTYNSTTPDSIRVSAMGFNPMWNHIWYAVEKSTATYVLSYINFDNYSDYPYARFPISGNHSLITSAINCGYLRIKKSTPSIIVEAQCPTNTHILVYYSTTGDSTWTAWGGTDGTTNIINTTGVVELVNPAGHASGYSTIEYNTIWLKFKFVTSSIAVSPILKTYSLRVLLRPDTYYGWSFSIIVEKDVMERTRQRDPRSTTYEMVEDLQLARDSYAPVDFMDIHGDNYKVYVTSIVHDPQEYELQQSGGQVNLYGMVHITLVEVYSGRKSDGTRIAKPTPWIKPRG